MLTPEENNYLAALYSGADDTWGLAWADLSTGEFVSTTATSDKLSSAVLRCSPKEILLPESLSGGGPSDIIAALESALPSTCTRTFRPKSSFDERGLALQQRGTARSSSGPVDPAEHAAVAAILDYVKFTQRSVTPLINAPLHVESSDHMIIDASAWRSLELAKVQCSAPMSSLQVIWVTNNHVGCSLCHLGTSHSVGRRRQAFYKRSMLLSRLVARVFLRYVSTVTTRYWTRRANHSHATLS